MCLPTYRITPRSALVSGPPIHLYLHFLSDFTSQLCSRPRNREPVTRGSFLTGPLANITGQSDPNNPHFPPRPLMLGRTQSLLLSTCPITEQYAPNLPVSPSGSPICLSQGKLYFLWEIWPEPASKSWPREKFCFSVWLRGKSK